MQQSHLKSLPLPYSYYLAPVTMRQFFVSAKHLENSLYFADSEITPGAPCIQGWVGPRAGLDTKELGTKNRLFSLWPIIILTELSKLCEFYNDVS
jgi:hypothetical protein